MVVYHNDRQTLQRIKESKQLIQHETEVSNITRNAILLFMLELLQNCLKQPDAHADLFYFLEDVLSGLYKSSESQLANLPLFYIIHLSLFLDSESWIIFLIQINTWICTRGNLFLPILPISWLFNLL